MNTLEAIGTRRSVRRFNNQEIDKDTIDKLLRAGMSAPSANNEQPWHFIVIDDRTILDKIPTVHPYAKMCLEAKAAIIPCVDMDLAVHGEFWIQDLSAATENILLAVRELGLASVWVGVHPREDRISGIHKLLSLPDNIVPFCLLPLGYSDVEQKEIDRYKNGRIHTNKW